MRLYRIQAHCRCLFFAEKSAWKRSRPCVSLAPGELTYLDPRSHRNARACSFAARLTRSDDLLQQGTRELCALTRSVQQGAEPRALSVIRYGTRYEKWAGGSRSQTHRRAAKGGFTQDDVKVRRPWGPIAASFVPRLLLKAASIFVRYRYRWYRSNTACHGVWSKASNGGVLARALPEGLRYLST